MFFLNIDFRVIVLFGVNEMHRKNKIFSIDAYRKKINKKTINNPSNIYKLGLRSKIILFIIYLLSLTILSSICLPNIIHTTFYALSIILVSVLCTIGTQKIWAKIMLELMWKQHLRKIKKGYFHTNYNEDKTLH